MTSSACTRSSVTLYSSPGFVLSLISMSPSIIIVLSPSAVCHSLLLSCTPDTYCLLVIPVYLSQYLSVCLHQFFSLTCVYVFYAFSSLPISLILVAFPRSVPHHNITLFKLCRQFLQPPGLGFALICIGSCETLYRPVCAFPNEFAKKHLVFLVTFFGIDRCMPFQIMSNQINWPQADSQGVETSQRNGRHLS